MQSPQRRAEHRAVANRTRRDTDAANEWAETQGVKLNDLDGDDASPNVSGARLSDAAVQPWDAGSDVRFSPEPLGFDDTPERLALRAANGDDHSLALLNQRYRSDRRNDRAEQLQTITGNGTRQVQRRVRDAGKRLANFVQIAANIETTPEAVFEVLHSLPNELQAEVARLAQRDADMRAIEKVVTANARKPRLSEGVHRVLVAIGRYDAATRERLSELSIGEQKIALVDLVATWRRDCCRARAKEWRSEQRFKAAIAQIDLEVLQ